jgi:hypothetical protein
MAFGHGICAAMASLRSGSRKDGTTYTQVRYRLNGKETSTSFDDPVHAVEFKRMVQQLGAKALEVIETTDAATRHYTLSAWLRHYLDHKTGVERSTLYHYEKYVEKEYRPGAPRDPARRADVGQRDRPSARPEHHRLNDNDHEPRTTRSMTAHVRQFLTRRNYRA